MAAKALSKTATFLLLLTAALPVLAGRQSTADAWREGLREIDQKLRARQWVEAEKQTLEVADQIVEETGMGKGAAYTLALVSAFRAIAEAGQGREKDADWHWATALNLFPEIAKTDLSPYGPPAAGLKARQPRLEPVRPPADGAKLVDPQAGNPKGLQPPKLIRQVRPSFPEGLRLMRVTGTCVIEAILGEDGVPYRPRVLKDAPGPAMEYEALEALRQWRFEPAKLEGRPVKVYYVITIDFHFKR